MTSTFYVNLVDFNGKLKFLPLILRYLFPPVFIPVLSSRLGWALVGLAIFARGISRQQLLVVDISNRFGRRVSALMSFSH
jgi:hypothetical protein